MPQEVHDLATVAELFAADALCFALVVCLAAHLPHPLRAVALRRARDTVSHYGLPVSKSSFEESAKKNGEPQVAIDTRSGPAHNDKAENIGPDSGSDNHEEDVTFLHPHRHGMGNFVAGVLTNVTQLYVWAYPPVKVVDDDTDDTSDGDDDRGEGGFLRKSSDYGRVVSGASLFLDRVKLS